MDPVAAWGNLLVASTTVPLLIVALVALAVAVAAIATAASLLRTQARAHARERQQLIDRVCHLADKPVAHSYEPPRREWQDPDRDFVTAGQLDPDDLG